MTVAPDVLLEVDMVSHQNYTIALKREYRGSAPEDWQERLKHIRGLHVIGEHPARLQVRATPKAIERVRSVYGSMYHIEETIPHMPS